MVWGKSEKLLASVLVGFVAICVFTAISIGWCFENRVEMPTTTPPTAHTPVPTVVRTPWKDLLNPDFRLVPTPTPSVLLVDDIPDTLLDDLQTVPWRLDALFQSIRDCVARGDLDWSRYSPFFEVVGVVSDDIALDTADGVMDYYDEAYIRQFIADVHAKLDEIEIQCIR